MKKCKQVHKKLLFYAEGDLPRHEEQALKQHLETCKTCRQLAHHIQETLNALPRQPVETNPFLLTRIMQQLEDRKQKQAMHTVNALHRRRILQPVIILLILIIGAWIGIMLGGNMQSQQQLTSVDDIKQEIYFDDLQYETIENFLLSE